MTQIVWNRIGDRYFEFGVDRGVLYVDKLSGVPWNGLISVSQSPSGGDATPYYLDGVKYINVPGREEFTGTIEAFTYPDEFSLCDGMEEIGGGLFVDQQRRKTFGLSYRTRIGNDVEGADHGYKLHIVYNALTSPSSNSFSSLGNSLDPMKFSWSFTTKAVISGPSLRPSAHVVLDSRKIKPETLSEIEKVLYGTSTTRPRLIGISELIPMFPTLKIVDNGDGTWTATGTDYEIRMLNEDTIEINSDTIEYLDGSTYTVSSIDD